MGRLRDLGTSKIFLYLAAVLLPLMGLDLLAFSWLLAISVGGQR